MWRPAFSLLRRKGKHQRERCACGDEMPRELTDGLIWRCRCGRRWDWWGVNWWALLEESTRAEVEEQFRRDLWERFDEVWGNKIPSGDDAMALEEQIRATIESFKVAGIVYPDPLGRVTIRGLK